MVGAEFGGARDGMGESVGEGGRAVHGGEERV